MKPLEDAVTLSPDSQRFTNSNPEDRRAQMRSEGVLSEIENSTYAVLRKHEKSPRKTA